MDISDKYQDAYSRTRMSGSPQFSSPAVRQNRSLPIYASLPFFSSCIFFFESNSLCVFTRNLWQQFDSKKTHVYEIVPNLIFEESILWYSLTPENFRKTSNPAILVEIPRTYFPSLSSRKD